MSDDPAQPVQPEKPKRKRRQWGDGSRPHKTVCISLYDENISNYKDRIVELKRRGYSKANLSWLIRHAMKAFDETTLPPPDLF